jgi:hypothetical protein
LQTLKNEITQIELESWYVAVGLPNAQPREGKREDA